MFFKNLTPEGKKNDSPVDITTFLIFGEYDQGDKAIILYDDLYDLLYDNDNVRTKIIGRLQANKPK